jgi:hypothetical protein
LLAGVAFSLPAYGRPMVTTVETTAKVKIGQKRRQEKRSKQGRMAMAETGRKRAKQ